MCLAQGHNAVMLLKLESAAPQSRVKHSTTEPLRSPNFCRENVIILSLCMQLCYGHQNVSQNLSTTSGLSILLHHIFFTQRHNFIVRPDFFYYM